MVNREQTTIVVPEEDGLRGALSGRRLRAEFCPGFARYRLLARVARSARPCLGDISVVSGGGLFFREPFVRRCFPAARCQPRFKRGTVFGVDHETGAGSVSVLDSVLLRMFRGMLLVINLVQGFSPIDSLSTGRSITWLQLIQAFGQIVLLMGGLAAVIGMTVLTRRELATAQPKA
jgi:hypothetical protein